MIAVVAVLCSACEIGFTKRPIDVARGSGRFYCSRRCAGLGRRVERSDEEKRDRKSKYDAQRRIDLAGEIRAAKAAHHRKTYDPAKARAVRQAHPGRHTAYMREYMADPEKKAAKVEYDRARREAAYAEYGECQRLVLALEREVRRLIPEKYERQKARGYFDNPKCQDRKRAAKW